jgi:hypothetical protein
MRWRNQRFSPGTKRTRSQRPWHWTSNRLPPQNPPL